MTGAYGVHAEAAEMLSVGVLRRTIVELCIVGLLGFALGSGVNAVRGSGSLKLAKNYFDKGVPQKEARPRVTSERPAQVVREAAVGESPDASGVSLSLDSEATSESGHLDHGYQEITFGEVVEVFNDPATSTGLNVFIDARNDEAYKEGHIPGAVQCDPYQVGRYIDDVLTCANGADKVVVYCDGGDCEDSIFACRELIEAGVPYEAVYLFAGGWKEWTARKMPVEGRGAEE